MSSSTRVVPVVVALLGIGAWGVYRFDRQSPDTPEPVESPTGAPAKPRVLTVAAASDLKFALDEIVREFQAAQPDCEVKVSYGSSGNLFAQLTNRAPFDLFFSADADYARKLVDSGEAQQTAFVYGRGRIVIWVRRDSPVDVEQLGVQAVLDPAVRKVAIANPKHAPYGRAAEAALNELGVYDQVRQKLVLGENVAQTMQFVQTGAAEIGVISHSLAVAPALRDQGRFWEIPLDAYPPLEQAGVILSWAKHRRAAESLRDFVLAADGREILQRYGFLMPGE